MGEKSTDATADGTGGAVPPKRVNLRWTVTRRKRFLAELAASYDVEAACRVAELDWPTVCLLRVRHPEFAAAFADVIAAGYDRLEAMLLRQAGAASAQPTAQQTALAQLLLRQRGTDKAGRAGSGGKPGAKPAHEPSRRPSKDALIDTIIAKTAPLRAAMLEDPSHGQAARHPRAAIDTANGRTPVRAAVEAAHG